MIELVQDDGTTASSVPAGALMAAHLGALVRVSDGLNSIEGVLREVEHGFRIADRSPRTKLWLDLGAGGAAWPSVSPVATVEVVQWGRP